MLFLKIYGPEVNQSSAPGSGQRRIAFTHAVQTFLRQNNFPVPRVLPNKKGETFSLSAAPPQSEEDNSIYVLSEFVEGDDYDASRPTDQLQSAGEMLGLLHRRLHGFQSPIEFPWPPVETEIFTELNDRFARLQSVAGDSQTPPVSQYQLDRWLQEVEELKENFQCSILNSQFSRGWVIHGDFRAQNLKFDEGRICAILDLDTTRPADRLYDLAYALVFFPAVYQDSPLTADQRSRFLHAYERICPLSELERRMLSAHLRLAFIRGITLWLDLY